MPGLTHTDPKGKANMVDVGSKPDQQRRAKAEGFIHLSAETIKLIRENLMKKGDERAGKIYASIGTYFGYAVAQYSEM